MSQEQFQETGNSESTIDNSQQTDASQGQTETASAPTITDIGSLEKFKFEGKEWTPAELKSAYMMQADYTRKTQAIAEEKRYTDNLQADLNAVRQDPNLMEKFMSIYPQKYHAYLDYVINKTSNQQTGNTQSNTTQNSLAQLDPTFYRDFLQMKSELQAEKVTAIEKQLDAQFEVLSKKYPYADESAVLAKADAYLQQGGELNSSAWDKLWKENNERTETLAKQFYSKQVNAQKEVNKKSRDIGNGGAIPGQAPVRPKTMKEASKFLLEDMERS